VAGRVKHGFLGGLLLLAIIVGSGQPLPAQVIWELEDSRARVVLLGSMHLLRDHDWPLPEAVMLAYAAADEIIMELDPAATDISELQALIFELGLAPPGQSLPALLGERAWNELAAISQELGLDPALLVPWQPWYAAMLLTRQMLDAQGFRAELGIESWIGTAAVRDGKTVSGLETMAGQLSALASLPLETQRRFLSSAIEDSRQAAELSTRLVNAWRSADLEVLVDEMLAGMQEEPQLYEQLIVARNRDFARQISALADTDGSYLVVIGALHLVGEDSVPAMLRQKGFAISLLQP